MRAGLGADFAMLVHLRMAGAFRGTGAAIGDAGGQLRFEELTMTDLIRARHDARGRCGDYRAILIEPDTADQALHVLFGETRIGAGVAGLNARGTGIDTQADSVDMTRLFRMRTEHRADGDCGHAEFLSAVEWPNATRYGAKSSKWNREFRSLNCDYNCLLCG